MIQNFKHSCYVTCMYDSLWYVGFIEKVNSGEGDTTIRFMHPHEPSPSSYWPDNDSCEWPFSNILYQIDIVTAKERIYTLSWDLYKLIEAKFSQL